MFSQRRSSFIGEQKKKKTHTIIIPLQLYTYSRRAVDCTRMNRSRSVVNLNDMHNYYNGVVVIADVHLAPATSRLGLQSSRNNFSAPPPSLPLIRRETILFTAPRRLTA